MLARCRRIYSEAWRVSLGMARPSSTGGHCLPPMLFQMRGDMLVHLEHRDLLLAEDLGKLVVGQDFALVRGVLQFVLLDVVPHLADDLPAGQGACADDCRQ